MTTLNKIILGVLLVAILVWLGSHDPSLEMNKANERPETIGIMY
jgi:hypothetical protein